MDEPIRNLDAYAVDHSKGHRDEVSFRYHKGESLVGVVGGSALLAFGLFLALLFLRSPEQPRSQFATLATTAIIAGSPILLGFGLLVTFGRKLFRSAPVLILNREGIIDAKQNPAKLFPWSEIADVTMTILRKKGSIVSATLILRLMRSSEAKIDVKHLDLLPADIAMKVQQYRSRMVKRETP